MILAYSGEQVFNVWKHAPEKLVFFDLRNEQKRESIELPDARAIDLKDLESVFKELGSRVGVFVVPEGEQLAFINFAIQCEDFGHDIVLMKETKSWPLGKIA